MTAPVEFECEMQEAVYPEDPTSGLSDIPTFNGYAAGGDVVGELVYVNFGRIEDYEYLDERNISLEVRPIHSFAHPFAHPSIHPLRFDSLCFEEKIWKSLHIFFQRESFVPFPVC